MDGAKILVFAVKQRKDTQGGVGRKRPGGAQGRGGPKTIPTYQEHPLFTNQPWGRWKMGGEDKYVKKDYKSHFP